jgi:hypothetical protein
MKLTRGERVLREVWIHRYQGTNLMIRITYYFLSVYVWGGAP